MPYQEGEYRPYLSRPVVAARTVYVQQLHKLFRVEVFLRRLRGEVFLHIAVVFVFFKPYADRYGEAQLVFLRRPRRTGRQRRNAHSVLRFVLGHTVTGGYLLRQRHNFFVKEGHPKLQRVSHAHLVGLQQDVSRHPKVEIKILHLRDFVVIAALVVKRLGDRRGRGSIGLYFQYRLALFFREDVGVADEALLEALRAPDKEVYAVLFRQLLRYGSQSLAYGLRDFVVFCHVGGVVVDVVAAEDLVGALSAQHYLDLLRSQPAHEKQRCRRRVGKRLIHVILYLCEIIPVFLRLDDVGEILLADVL